MSSDLFCIRQLFFSDPFETLQEIQENRDDLIQENNNPIDETSSLDQIASALLSSSPPRVELENLSLSQLEKTDYSVKTEECQLNFDVFSGFGNCFSPHSFDEAYETTAKFMQRSFSSNCYENKQNSSRLPHFDCVLVSQLSSPESSFSAGQRVCSTGDLHMDFMKKMTME